jgi:ABC-type molybdate transport system permease subunit
MLSILPIITPPFVIGLGLILLFGRSGLVNLFLEWTLGIEPSRWIYGMPGILVAQVFAFTPIAFLVLIGVVEGVSPTLEEAAQTLRAGRWRTFVDVSLPLMRPGIANAFLISFIESIADFGNPILLGGNFGVLSTEIFFSVVGAQLDHGRAAVLEMDVADQIPVVPHSLGGIEAAVSEVTGIQAQADQRSVEALQQPLDLAGRLEVRPGMGVDDRLEPLLEAQLPCPLQRIHHRREANHRQPRLGVVADGARPPQSIRLVDGLAQDRERLRARRRRFAHGAQL